MKSHPHSAGPALAIPAQQIMTEALSLDISCHSDGQYRCSHATDNSASFLRHCTGHVMLIVTDQDGTCVATFTKSQQTNLTEHNRNGHKEESAKWIKEDGYHILFHLTKVKNH